MSDDDGFTVADDVEGLQLILPTDTNAKVIHWNETHSSDNSDDGEQTEEPEKHCSPKGRGLWKKKLTPLIHQRHYFEQKKVNKSSHWL